MLKYMNVNGYDIYCRSKNPHARITTPMGTAHPFLQVVVKKSKRVKEGFRTCLSVHETRRASTKLLLNFKKAE